MSYYIMFDQDCAIMYSLMSNLLKIFDIKFKSEAPCNHQPLQAEYGIKSLSTILTIHLTGVGQKWPKYLLLALT